MPESPAPRQRCRASVGASALCGLLHGRDGALKLDLLAGQDAALVARAVPREGSVATVEGRATCRAGAEVAPRVVLVVAGQALGAGDRGVGADRHCSSMLFGAQLLHKQLLRTTLTEGLCSRNYSGVGCPCDRDDHDDADPGAARRAGDGGLAC